MDEFITLSNGTGVFQWFEGIFGGKTAGAFIAMGVVAAILIALIIWFIVALVKTSKKNKKLKAEKTTQEKQVDQEPAKEEVKKEEPKKEEPVKEEPKKVEPQKEGPKKEEKPQEAKKEAVKPAAKPAAKPVAKQTGKKEVVGKYEIFQVKDSYIYRLKASNGEILVTSELYSSLKGAQSAIDTVIKNAETGELQISKDKHGLFQFKLFGGNKRLLVISANYPTQSNCESAAESFKRFAANSPIVVLDEDPQHLMEQIDLEAKDAKEGGKIVIEEAEGNYSFKLLASNGKIICSSNDFKSRAAALNGIETLKQAINEGEFFVIKDKNNNYQFKLYSATGRAVVYSEVYSSKASAISAANSVNNFIDLAKIEEE